MSADFMQLQNLRRYMSSVQLSVEKIPYLMVHGTEEEKSQARKAYESINPCDRHITLFYNNVNLEKTRIENELQIKILTQKDRARYITKYEKYVKSQKISNAGEKVGIIGGGILGGSLGGVAVPALFLLAPVGLATTAVGATIHVINDKPLTMEVCLGKQYKENLNVSDEEAFKNAEIEYKEYWSKIKYQTDVEFDLEVNGHHKGRKFQRYDNN